MSNTKKNPAKDNFLIYIAIAFIVGFLSGTAFTVYKLKPGNGASSITQQSEMSEQQLKAIAHLEEDVGKTPDKYQSWTQLANLYFDTGQYEKAVNAYEQSLKLHTGTADIWTDLGVMYRRTDQYQKAIDAFDKAISMDPTHEISRLNKGIVLMYDLNKPEEAVQSWENLLKINP
ncbi:MAG: tetratricopeptide repeat protein, partial [Desulfopila sp.]|nr:tetratricopeptide repeat protein [Desulfopila sp.]